MPFTFIKNKSFIYFVKKAFIYFFITLLSFPASLFFTNILELNQKVEAASGTGGTITYTDSNGLNPRSSPAYTNGYVVHTFTSNGSFVPNGSMQVQVLVVGAGGGGYSEGNSGGGGGGGGQVIYNNSYSVTSQTYNVTIGNGVLGGNGNQSIFGSITASGGAKGLTNGAVEVLQGTLMLEVLVQGILVDHVLAVAGVVQVLLVETALVQLQEMVVMDWLIQYQVHQIIMVVVVVEEVNQILL